MFTGIVETTGEVLTRESTDDGLRLRIGAPGLDDLGHGQSIAISGVCLTVETHGTITDNGLVEAADDTAGDTDAASDGTASGETADDGTTPSSGQSAWFEVFCAAETVRKTYAGELAVGDAVNVERALPADGRFDGHLVQGHVDTTAEVTSIAQVGEDWRFGFSVPEELDRYIVTKGSIAVDGISLTVAERDETSFDVAVIPTTYQLTNLSEKSVGDPVHLEADVVAKYVESMLDGYARAVFE